MVTSEKIFKGIFFLCALSCLKNCTPSKIQLLCNIATITCRPTVCQTLSYSAISCQQPQELGDITPLLQMRETELERFIHLSRGTEAEIGLA